MKDANKIMRKGRRSKMFIQKYGQKKQKKDIRKKILNKENEMYINKI